MSSIRKINNKNGSTKYQLRYRDETGKERSHTFPTRKEADRAGKEIDLRLLRVKHGLEVARPCNKTFRDVVELWERTKGRTLRNAKKDRSIIRSRLLPTFGDTLLKNLRPSDFDEYTADCFADGLSPKTIRNHLGTVTVLLNMAVEEGYLVKAPKVRKPKLERKFEETRFLKTDDEVKRFLVAARAEGPVAHAFYATAVYTGMRQSEIAALTWADIDFDAPSIKVTKSTRGKTKSGHSRTIPIHKGLRAILLALQDVGISADIVFPNQRGTVHAPDSRLFRQVFRRVLVSAGLPEVIINGKTRSYIRFHDLRHTFASHMMMNGGNIYVLKDLLGHSDIAMTQRYAHLAPGIGHEEIKKLSF